MREKNTRNTEIWDEYEWKTKRENRMKSINFYEYPCQKIPIFLSPFRVRCLMHGQKRANVREREEERGDSSERKKIHYICYRNVCGPCCRRKMATYLYGSVLWVRSIGIKFDSPPKKWEQTNTKQIVIINIVAWRRMEFIRWINSRNDGKRRESHKLAKYYCSFLVVFLFLSSNPRFPISRSFSLSPYL